MIEYTVQVDEGTTRWYLNGKEHREDGPAIERARGSKEWWINGSKEWYINGKELTEDEFNQRKTKELSVGEIETLLGYKVKVVK